MKTIEKKVWPEYFQKILDGKKNFELRLNDFDITEGDTLVLTRMGSGDQRLHWKEIGKRGWVYIKMENRGPY